MVLFHYTELANLNAYAGNERLSTHLIRIPKNLTERLQHKIAFANNWYEQNGMIVNPDRHQAIVLGNTDYEFSSPAELN